MNITMVITSDSDDEARELLRGFGMPFKTEESARRQGGTWPERARHATRHASGRLTDHCNTRDSGQETRMASKSKIAAA